MAYMVSRRAQAVEYAIRDVMVKAEELKRQGRELLYLNIGDPVKFGFDTPPHIINALQNAVRDGLNYYSPSEGLKELREAVAEKERKVNGASIDADNVLITAGISEAILFLMATTLNPGDEVLLPGPCYPPYLTYANFFDGKAVTYRTVEDHEWAPDLSDLERKITHRTKLIVIINPNNPSGALYSPSEITKIVELAAKHQIPIAADEIYDRIVFEEGYTGVASLAKDVPMIGLNGFSKAYLMTGWRLGYLYLQDPEGKIQSIWDGFQRLSRVRLCANTPVQVAGVEALRGPQDHIQRLASELKRRRDYAWKRTCEIPGLMSTKPRGAFYIFPRLTTQGKTWTTDEQFVGQLLRSTGVLTVHGSGFGPEFGRGHFRAVILPPEATLGKAFDLIGDFMKANLP